MAKARRSKEVVMETRASKNALLKWVTLAALTLVVGVGAVFALTIPGLGKYQKVKAVNGAVSLPVAKVSDGTAHFYKYTDGGKDIGFFVVKGTDGALHVAFDSCDVCFREKKGYVQDGDAMLCKNCGKRFQTNRIGPHAIGGCNPSYLPSSTEGAILVIRAAELQAGAKYF